MPAKTTTLANTTLDTNLAGSLYLALFSVAPTAGTAGTELAGDGYARKAITWAAAASASKDNSALIDFDAATADWDEAVAFGIMDASSGGNLLYFGAIDPGLTVLEDQFVRVPVGGLVVSES
jgi:hypothetical protein